MEFKIRCMRKQKAHKVQNKQEGGFVRIKVRGRKRWVKKAAPAAAEAKEA
jgi:hypothetical protein